MKHSIQTGSLAAAATPCLACGLKAGARVAKRLGAAALFDAAAQDFKDKAGTNLLVRLPSGSKVQRILVAGGTDGQIDEAAFRKIVRAVAKDLRALEAAGSVLWALSGVRVRGKDAHWRAFVAAYELALALYRFDAHKSKPKKPKPGISSIQFHADARSEAAVAKAVREGRALREGLELARNLGNQPPNLCNPAYLLKEARKLGRHPKATVSALNEKRMKELGMGAFLSVSQGSAAEGRMILIQYRGGPAKDAPIALIGKGITFDTGGISLKPGKDMDQMKFDMCGAASVLGTVRAALAAELPINLIAILAAAENMPGGRASRPGDIVKTHSGKTVEILNTDAEGRLVLCDALSYAKRYKPKAVIDVATLTGACVIALGHHASGLYANQDALAEALLQAGEWTGDRAWRMPLWQEYQSSLDSNFADMANIGGRPAGSVTAACFLARFAEDCQWAHLDVAGTAWRTGKAKGATGRPVALLFKYLLDAAA